MDVEIIECDVWELVVFFDFLVVGQVIQNFKIIGGVKFVFYESVEDEELVDDVDIVQDFNEYVQIGQVCVFVFVIYDYVDFGCFLFYMDYEVIVVLMVGFQLVVDVDGDVFYCFVFFFGFSSLGFSSYGDDFFEVEFRVVVQYFLDEIRDFEEECYKDQDDGYLLVVGQFFLVVSVVVQGNGFFQRDIVCVFNLVVGFCI